MFKFAAFEAGKISPWFADRVAAMHAGAIADAEFRDEPMLIYPNPPGCVCAAVEKDPASMFRRQFSEVKD
jgi:hypothetical protein